MRSPAAAIAWDLYQRHRWGVWAILAYLVAVSMIGSVGYTVDNPQRMAWTLMVPLGGAYYYLLAMFSLGLAGDVASRGSLYPARYFTLPVSNAALAGWPMLYGTVTVAVLWVVTATLAPWPSSAYTPVLWPALFLGAFLAWTQVILWLPYPVRGLRILAALFWLSAFGTTGLHSIHNPPPDALMVAFLAPQLPLAFLVGRYAVGRARCADTPDWRRVFARVAGRPGTDSAKAFGSPFRAQVAYEWGHYGWSLPLWVAILLPVELALLFLVSRPEFVLLILLITLLTPPVMATFVATAVSKGHLLSTLPMSTAMQVGAKLAATAASVLVAWGLVLVAVPMAMVLSDTWTVVDDAARPVMAAFGTARGIALHTLIIVGFVLATWKLVLQGVFIGLSGRPWVTRLYIGIALAVLVAVVPLYFWIRESAPLGALISSATPWRWGLAILVGLKLAVASWAVLRLQHANLLGGDVLLRGAVLWSMTVFALFGVFVWILTTPQMPSDILMAVAILAIPLVRLSTAPLALDWNRHRW